MSLDDLYSGDQVAADPALPDVMEARVLEVDARGRLTVTVADLDGGDRARVTRGSWPAALPGEACWVTVTPDGGLLTVAWESSRTFEMVALGAGVAVSWSA